MGKWQLTGNPLLGMVYDNGFEEYYVWLQSSLLHLFPELDSIENSRYWEPIILDNGNLIIGDETDYGPDMFADWAVDFIEYYKDERFFLYYPMVLVHRQNGEYPPMPDGSGGTIPGTLRSHVAYVDSIVGRILDAITMHGIENKTMVILTADNGSQDDVGGQWSGFKKTPTENGVRVPFLSNILASCKPISIAGKWRILSILQRQFIIIRGHF